MNVAQETLGFRRQGLSPCLSLLMSAFALLIAPASLPRHLHSHRERSSTTVSNPLRAFHAHPTRARTAAHREAQLAMNKTLSGGLLTIRSFGYRLEPRYIFRAGRLDQ